MPPPGCPSLPQLSSAQRLMLENRNVFFLEIPPPRLPEHMSVVLAWIMKVGHELNWIAKKPANSWKMVSVMDQHFMVIAAPYNSSSSYDGDDCSANERVWAEELCRSLRILIFYFRFISLNEKRDKSFRSFDSWYLWPSLLLLSSSLRPPLGL